MLQKKRSSLCHQSEVSRALESRASQEQVTLHEFQKVKSKYANSADIFSAY